MTHTGSYCDCFLAISRSHYFQWKQLRVEVTSPSLTYPLCNSCPNHPGRNPVLASLHYLTTDQCLCPILFGLANKYTATL